jgi:hypothetical protein
MAEGDRAAQVAQRASLVPGGNANGPPTLARSSASFISRCAVDVIEQGQRCLLDLIGVAARGSRQRPRRSATRTRRRSCAEATSTHESSSTDGAQALPVLRLRAR